MPAEGQSAPSVDRERFPDVKAHIGEDPARFLDRPLVDPTAEGDTEPIDLALARVRGIDSLTVAKAWRAVERNLDRGPRQQVIDAIEARIAHLEAYGERQPLGPDRDDWEPTEIDTGDHPSISERWTTGGRTLGDGETREGGASADETTASALDDFGVATDGGSES